MQAVADALKRLAEEFCDAPTLFFTEGDLSSRLYHLVQGELDYARVEAADGSLHYLVHHEYPTPFRCDMKGRSFTVMDEDKRTPKGGKYKRGHYDLIVFNPRFVERATLEVVRGQDYRILKQELPLIMESTRAVPVLAGLELAHNRTPFLSEAHVDRWCDEVLQDYRKLEASRTWMGRPFLKEIFLAAFDACDASHRGASEALKKRARDKLGQYPNVWYYTPSG